MFVTVREMSSIVAERNVCIESASPQNIDAIFVTTYMQTLDFTMFVQLDGDVNIYLLDLFSIGKL